MCGIAGVLYRDGSRPDEGTLRAMASTIAHRGPDGEGVRAFEGCGLAHRRLAVIDLSTAATQPMVGGDGRTWVIFNGEIYNFKELRAQLERLGHRFHTQSDTEVILEAYLRWGEACIAKLDGMFALALWNDREKRLLLARDRTGKKPLYVYEDDRKLIFGSEIKAILAHREVDRQQAPEAIAQFLSHGYVPTPGTFYERTRKLRPSAYEIHSLASRESHEVQYWDFPFRKERGINRSELPEVQEHIRELFFAAVKRRMVADVPLGAFLSGGIDSTLVVAAMSQLSSRPVKTFSIGFEGYPDWDETRYARLVAERYGTEHTEFKVTPQNFDLVEKLAWHFDEPFADSSAIPTHIVSKLARQHVTVALTGDGGDEVFAGYPRFVAAAAAERVPRVLRRMSRRLLQEVPVGPVEHAPLERARRLAFNMSKDMPDRLRGWLSLCTVAELRQMLVPALLPLADETAIARSYRLLAEKSAAADPVNQALYINARTYLLDDLNVKVDRAAMAVGLECRSPFLDTALMEFVAGLPGSLKVRGKVTKWVLKRAFADLLPTEIVHRRKMGFGIPIGAWFRGSLQRQLEERLLSSPSPILRAVDRQALERVLASHQVGDRDRGLLLWGLLQLTMFLSRSS